MINDFEGMRSTTYWLFRARELAIPQIPKFVLLLAANHAKFLFTNASPTFALIKNVPCHATRPPPLLRPPSQACTLLRVPRQPGALSRCRRAHARLAAPVLPNAFRRCMLTVR